MGEACVIVATDSAPSMSRSENYSHRCLASRIVANWTPQKEDCLTITELHRPEHAGSERDAVDEENASWSRIFLLPHAGEYAMDQEQDLLAVYSQT